MKRALFTFLALVLCLAFVIPANSGSLETYAVSSKIAMITTNPAEDCSTAMNVGFHTPLDCTGCSVQYTTADDADWQNAKTVAGTYKAYGADANVNPFYGKSSKDDNGTNYTQEHTFNDYNVTLSGLTPDTEYKYRIFDGAEYSDTYRFKTAANDGSEWSFLVTGDFHEYYKTYGAQRAAQATKAINAGIDLAGQLGWPEIEHIVSVGDIVAWGVAYNQWQNVLNQPYMKNYSFANCIGNHDDMDRSSNSSSAYNSIIFNNPTNGWNYGDEIGTVYYYTYNNVLFIVVNYLKASNNAQEAWAQSVIDKMAGQYQYSVLVNHRPATSKYSGKSYSYFWNYWADFCDKNKIDLVLAGDHHCYMRSQPLRDGAMVSDYGADNPDATVYLAGDSSDGERGSSTDVKAFDTTWVASNYYRYNYSGSTKDITTMIIRVGKDRLTTEFVYYEDIASAKQPEWKEGSVNNHANFYYGDTSYVYASNHETSGEPPVEEDPNLPKAAKNYFAQAEGGKYMYPTTNYPGTASYYQYGYYGDNATQGGEWIANKLNDGVIPDGTAPGSKNAAWAVYFGSAAGDPEVTIQLGETAYLNKISVVSILTGSYGAGEITEVGLGMEEGNYTVTKAYEGTDEANGTIHTYTVKFTEALKAKYIHLKFKDYVGTPSRLAIGEIEVWGDNTVGDVGAFKLKADSKYQQDEKYVTAAGPNTKASDVVAQFGCDVAVYSAEGEKLADDALVGTGCIVKKLNIAGEPIDEQATVIIPGDLNGDAEVTAPDYMAARLAITDGTGTELALKAADVNLDGVVSSADYIIIKCHVKGTLTIGG